MPNESITFGIEDAFSNPLAKMAQELADARQRTDALATSLNTIGGAGGTAPQVTTGLAAAGAAGLAMGAALGIAQVAVKVLGDALQSITSFIPNAINAYQQWGMQVYEVSRNLGLTTESASGLVNAADDLGVGVANLSTGFGIFAKHLAGIEDLETTVTEGGKGFKEIVKDLGISLTDASENMRGFDELLPAIADKFASMPDSLQKTALAMSLFGRGGRELIPLLNQGSEGLKKFSDETTALGLSLSKEDIMGTRSFKLAKAEIDNAILSVQARIAQSLMPSIEKLAAFVSENIPKAFDTVMPYLQRFTTFLADNLPLLLTKFAELTTFISSNLQPILIGLATVATAIVVPALGALSVAIGMLSATISASFIPVVAAGAIALAPLTIAILAVGAAFAVLTKLVNDEQAKLAEAASMEQQRTVVTTQALGQQGDAYQKLLAQKKALEEQMMRSVDSEGTLQQAYQETIGSLNALEAKAATSRAALTDFNIAWLAAANLPPIVPQGIAESLNPMKQATKDAAWQMQESWVTYANNVKPLFFDIMGAMGQGTDGMVKQSRDAWQKIRDDAAQAASDIAKAMAEAAKAAGQAFTSGISGLSTALDNLNKPKGAQPFGGVDFEAQAVKAEKLRAQLPGLEEQLRRVMGVSTQKELNWKYPDPNKAAALKAEIRGVNNELAKTEQGMAEMAAANDAWANSGVAGVQAVRDAYKGMVGDMITSAQLSGQISDEFAQGWRDAVGVVQTPAESIALNLKRIMDQATEGGINTQRQVTVDLSAIMKAFDGDQAKLAKVLQDYWSGSIGWVQQYVKAMEGIPGYAGATEPTPGAGVSGAGAAKARAKSMVPDPQDIVEAYKPTQKAMTEQGTLASENYVKAMANEAAKQALALQKIGEDLSGGVAGGISSPASQAMLNTAITTVMSWLPEWAKALLGMHSASRVFVDIGVGIMQGLSAGIGQAGQLPVNALMGQIQELLKVFSGLSIDPRINEMADTVSNVVGAMGNAIDTLAKLKDYVSPARAKVDAAYADFDYIVRRLMDFGNRFVGALNYESIGNFGDTAGTLLDSFATGVETLIKLKDYTSPARSKIDMAYNDVVYLAGRLIGLANDIKKVIDWVNVSNFAENAGRIFEMVSAGVEALTKLRDYTSPARSAIDAAFNDIVYLAGRLIAQGDAIKKAINWETVSKFAENAGAVFGMVSEGIDALVKIKDYTSPARSAIDVVYNDIIYLAGRLIAQGNAIKKAIDWDAISKFASAANALVQAFATAMDALSKLSTYTSPARSAIDAAVNDMIYLIDRLQLLAGRKLSDTLGPILQSLGAGVAAMLGPLEDLRGYIALARDKTTGQSPVLEAFMLDLQGLFGRLGMLADWLAGQGTLKDKMIALGTVMTGIMGPVKTGLEILQQLATYIALPRGIDNTAPALDAFMQDLQGLFGRLASLAQWLYDQTDPTTRALNTLAPKMMALGAVMSSVFAPLKDIMSVLTDLRSYSGLPRNEGGTSPVIESFMNDLQGLFGRLAWLAQWLYEQIDPTTRQMGQLGPKMVQLGAAMSSVFGPLKTAIDTLTSMREYVKNAAQSNINISAVMDKVGSDIRLVLEAVKSWMEISWEPVEGGQDPFARRMIPAMEISQAMIDLMDKLNKLLSPLSSAISTLSGLIDLGDKLGKKSYDFAVIMVTVGTSLRAVILAVAAWQADTLLLAALDTVTTTFSANLQNALSPISTAVTTVTSLIDLTTRLADKNYDWGGIVARLGQAITVIVEVWQAYATTAWLTGLLASFPEDLATVYSNALDPLNQAIQLVSNLIGISEKLMERNYDWGGMVARIGQAITVIVEQWQAYATTVWLTGLLGEFPETLKAMFSNAIDPLNQSISLISSLISVSENLAKKAYDWGGMVSLIGQALKDIMAIWREKIDPNNLGWLPIYPTEFKDNLRNALEPLSQTVQIVSSLMGISEQLAARSYNWGLIVRRIGIALQSILLEWRGWVTGGDFLALAATFDADLAANLRNALDPLSQAVQIVSGLIGVSEQLAARSYNWSIIVRRIGIALQAILLEWKKWVEGEDFLALVGTFPATLNANLQLALGPLSQAIQIVTSLIGVSDSLAKKTYDWTGMVNKLGQALKDIIAAWIDYAADPSLGNTLRGFPDMLNGNLTIALGPLSQTIQIVSSLIGISEVLTNKTYDWTAMIELLGVALQDIVAAWIAYASNGSMLNTLRGFPSDLADALRVALDPLSQTIQIVSSLIDISEKLTAKAYDWSLITMMLGAAIEKILVQWQVAALNPNIIAALPTFTKEFNDQMQLALSPISLATSTISTLIDFSGKLGKKAWDWSLITMKLGGAIEKVLVQWSVLAQNADVLQALRNFPSDFSTKLQNALGPIRMAVDTLNAVGDYLGLQHRGTDIPVQVQMLADDVAAFVKAFSEAAAGIDVSESTVKLGEALNAIVGPVKSYIDDFYWIWRYVSVAARSGYTGTDPNYVPQQFKDIAHDLMLLLQTIGGAAEKLEAEHPGLIQAAADFGTLIQPIVDAVDSALKMFGLIATRPQGSFLDLVKGFGADLVAAMSYLATTLNIASEYGQTWHTNAYVFGYDIGHTWGIGIVDGIRSEEQAIRDEISIVGDMLRGTGNSNLASMVNQVGNGGAGENNAAAGGNGGGTVNINVSIPVQQLQNIDEGKLASMIRQQIGEIAKRNTRIFVPSTSTG